MDFIEILKTLMFEKQLNQSQIANIIGVKQSQISEWLKGKAKPGYDTLKIMAKKLNVSADFLLGLEDETGAKYVNSFNGSTFNNSGNLTIK